MTWNASVRSCHTQKNSEWSAHLFLLVLEREEKFWGTFLRLFSLLFHQYGLY